jgi:hypothetical protein
MSFVVGFPNDQLDVTSSPTNAHLNTVTSSGGTATAQTGTLNAMAGTITTATLTNTVDTKTTITITNSGCTANSTVFAVINSATIGTGQIYIQSVVPAANSFVITLCNSVALTGTSSVKIRFMIVS